MKSPGYLDWIREQPCVVSGGFSVPHHLIGKSGGITGGKECDLLTMPLSPKYHTGEQGIHKLGVKTWEKIYGNQWKYVAKTLQRAVITGKLVVT